MINAETHLFYKRVADYFDYDAQEYAKRYSNNHILQRLRNSFRWETEIYPFTNALEIGCGPGFDLAYWARRYPEQKVWGIDISPKMIKEAGQRIQQLKLTNACALQGAIETIPQLFPKKTFDLISIYFGALNTTYDMKEAAHILAEHLVPSGKLIITSINRWYLMHVILNFGLFRWKKAFERVRNRWQGYSPNRTLPSRCLAKRDIFNAFANRFRLLKTKGYSIFSPAWYHAPFFKAAGIMNYFLWELDEMLQKTPLQNAGEYSLYVLEKRVRN